MYKVGDKVLLRSNRGEGWHSGGRMDKYLNRVIEITSLDGYDNRFRFEYDTSEESWVFWFRDIVCFADPEIIERRKKEIEEEKKNTIIIEEQIRELVEENYGEDGYVEKSGSRINIYLRFPNMEITNSRDETNHIKDLYVKICIADIRIDQTYKFSVEFQGRRTTFSLAEYRSNYIHSHLPSGGFYNWNNFCLGSSDFSIIIENLKLSPTKENWELFLMSIPSYLSWESIEGGPHIQMRNICLSGQISESSIKEELKRISGSLPLEVFEWIDTLSIRETPYLYDFFNKHSKLRRLSLEGSNLEEDAKNYQDHLNRENKLKWKENVIDYSIYYEVPEEGNIEKSLVDKYIEILKAETKQFTKKINYARSKKELGEVGII